MDVDVAIRRLGGPTQAATKLGLARGAVAMWRVKGKIPLKHVPAVASALGIDPSELWPALAAAPAAEFAGVG